VTDLADVRAAWDQAARDDAIGNILTIPGITEEEFFERGRMEIDALLAHLAKLDVGQHRRGKAIDFGCGIGRLTVALAEHYQTVIGVDISQEMIARARTHPNVVYTDISWLWRMDRSIDLVYSNITLQHMPTELQESYVRGFVRVLHRDGVAVFEVPQSTTAQGDYRALSMYGTPLHEIARWVGEEAGDVIDVATTESAGPNATSTRYTVMRLL
jgi:ubiquinone/menaquinone biosynthesis C-methylase UbiE